MEPKIAMQDVNIPFFLPDSYDLDSSFTSTASSSTTFASTSSARSSLSLPSFAFPSSITPLPHSRTDPQWSAVRAAANLSPDGALHLSNLTLLRHLGSGNLARVFHCRLRGFEAGADFALKVVDLDVVARATTATDDRLSHVRAEALVLASIDHPFLPTLYARLDASHYVCFLIDYCPGGDLHSILRHRPGHRLPLPTVRFYAAEVLLALEYLHAQGFVYRDLKPENILLRADGHVMLSDFDLCFQADVSPSLRRLRRRRTTPHRRSCCFGASSPLEDDDEVVEFVAEPTEAYSRECVGTHEYLAPEVVAGNGYGSGVDWWAFGVFIYELLYGRTPFKGSTKEATLRNIAAGREVRFPGGESEAAAARDLVARLLVRDPQRRLGATAGAAEIKRHPFFEGIQWPLIRSSQPPMACPVDGAGAIEERRRGSRKWSGWNDNNNENNRSIIDKMVVKLGLGSKKGTTEGKNNNKKTRGVN